MVLLLGIECGGTHTTVALAKADPKGGEADAPIMTFQLGPGNFRLTSADGFVALFTEAFGQVDDEHAPAAIGLAVAGARHTSQHAELEDMVRSALAAMGGWRSASAATIPVRVSHDLESAALASGPLVPTGVRLVCIAGTGSCCYGRRGVALGGGEVRGGGWGHLLGDEGSGFMVGSGLLRLLTQQADQCRRTSSAPTVLMSKVLEAVGLADSKAGWDDMIGWVADASKDEVAALAKICLDAAAEPGADVNCLALVQSEAAKLSQTAAETLSALRGNEVTSSPEQVRLQSILGSNDTVCGRGSKHRMYLCRYSCMVVYSKIIHIVRRSVRR
jgi:N-acetylmuramic acid 6-phosphate etherase